jgi:hypothetical protein
VQLKTAQILRRCRIGRPADKGSEHPHVANEDMRVRGFSEKTRNDYDHARPQPRRLTLRLFQRCRW